MREFNFPLHSLFLSEVEKKQQKNSLSLGSSYQIPAFCQFGCLHGNNPSMGCDSLKFCNFYVFENMKCFYFFFSFFQTE